MSASVAGSVAAAYPKTLAASTQWNTFNPTSGGRRSYASSDTSYASPSYTDTPGWTWSAGGPLGGPGGYQLQIKMSADRFEGISAGSHPSHHSGLEIGGTNTGVLLEDNAGSNPVTAWVNVANTVSGAVHMHDYCAPNRGGGNAFTGNEVLYYQYVRS